MKVNTNLKLGNSETKPVSLKSDILMQDLNNELLLYDLARDKVFCLNETSLMIWNLCDGENTVEDIRRQISIQLKTQINEEMIWLALDKLKQEKLLQNHQEIEISFKGLSRRDVIRKAGLSTMIALPFISAVIAPNATSAQSQSCSSTTACFCNDASCLVLGDPALLMNPCINTNCSNSGGINCLCVGPFICSATAGLRLGRCGLV